MPGRLIQRFLADDFGLAEVFFQHDAVALRVLLQGGDQTPGRSAALLDPANDAARIRAMYTDPGFTRRGVGRRVLALCEEAARTAGFWRAEMMATMAGEPLYRACGYQPVERFVEDRGGVAVPLVLMGKAL